MSHKKDIWTQKIHNIGTKYSSGVGTQAQIDDDVDVGMLKKKTQKRTTKTIPKQFTKWQELYTYQ